MFKILRGIYFQKFREKRIFLQISPFSSSWISEIITACALSARWPLDLSSLAILVIRESERELYVARRGILNREIIGVALIYPGMTLRGSETGAASSFRLAISLHLTFVRFTSFAESDAGGWGHWTQWSPCSSSCVGGVRNRYRFCDTPPPRYGAKYCQVQATNPHNNELHVHATLTSIFMRTRRYSDTHKYSDTQEYSDTLSYS